MMPTSMNAATMIKTECQAMMIGQNQGKRAGNESGQAVSLHMNGVAQAELMISEEFSPVGIEHDVLAGTEKCDGGCQVSDQRNRKLWFEKSDCRNGRHQCQLRHQQPAAPPTQERQRVAIHDWRPQKLPGVWQADQREESNLRKTNTFGPQPGRYQLNQNVERQTGGEAGKKRRSASAD